MKYTSGPWQIVDDDLITADFNKNSDHVCVVSRSREEYKANARLIAVAPEMVRVLRLALNRLGAIGDDGSAHERMQIQDVLAKATGETVSYAINSNYKLITPRIGDFVQLTSSCWMVFDGKQWREMSATEQEWASA